VTSDSTLIAGERCLAAFKLLGRDRILPTTIDLDKMVLGEFAENTERKDFTASPAEATCSEAGERNRTRHQLGRLATKPMKSMSV
jgi:hypothetical protein